MNMREPKEMKRYVGIDNDLHGGMTDTGKIIRDAWIFEIIPETETCENWNVQGIQTLWDQVNEKWSEFGYQVNNLPGDVRERFDRIQKAAIDRARREGWDPEKFVAEDT